jgi:hypothetical protein
VDGVAGKVGGGPACEVSFCEKEGMGKERWKSVIIETVLLELETYASRQKDDEFILYLKGQSERI